ncbi:procathepsin L-like isoform X3 [Pectinophora gossypiella]|uniref:procathepsin L-like isoform X3 n=1 Tax=Pectinophora gossypiella TaxID=13191 RepID=UPI00214F01D5|nr:procathepsin L-like isoform X3 [Pectinophora gossypiella]
MYRLSLLLVGACALAAASRINNMGKPTYPLEEAEMHFEAFIENFNRSYSSEAEKKSRFEIFKKNLEDINRKNMNPEENAVFDITMFADLSVQEFIQQYTGLDSSLHVPGPKVIVSGPVTMDLPDNFDWRDKNAVTNVKNQGQCGSCWAFSTTGTIEGAYAIKHKKLVALSEQQLLICDTHDKGCDGGLMTQALKYLTEVGGIQSEDSYPYTADDDEDCEFEPELVVVNITGQKPYDLKDEKALREILVSEGPVAIAVDADSFQLYRKGIIEACTFKDVNHGVLLVGYGIENNIPYWIIKNSWGEKWGEDGFVRVKQGNNPCGILNDYAVTPVVA